MDDDVTAQVLLSLGRLEEGQARMRLDFNEEKDRTKDHRVVMYQKLDRLEENIGIVGQVAAQARDKSDAVRKVVDEDVKPATDDFRRVQGVGKTALWGVGVAAGLFGITAATIGSTVLAWIKGVLGIH